MTATCASSPGARQTSWRGVFCSRSDERRARSARPRRRPGAGRLADQRRAIPVAASSPRRGRRPPRRAPISSVTAGHDSPPIEPGVLSARGAVSLHNEARRSAAGSRVATGRDPRPASAASPRAPPRPSSPRRDEEKVAVAPLGVSVRGLKCRATSPRSTTKVVYRARCPPRHADVETLTSPRVRAHTGPERGLRRRT